MQFFLFFLIGAVLFHTFRYFPFSSIGIAIAVSVFLAVKKKPLIIFILLAGIGYAFLRYEPVQNLPYKQDVISLTGSFISYPARTESGNFKQTFRTETAADRETGEKLHALGGKEIMIVSNREFQTGIEYALGIRMLKSGKRLNPGQSIRNDLYASLAEIYLIGSKKETLALKVEECRHSINMYIQGHFHKESGELIASITTGRITSMDERLRNAFNVTGLAHILSISGTHFGLLSLMLFSIFRFIIEALPYRLLQRITLFLTPSQAAAILCVPFLVLYLGLSGASIPAIRSFIMIGLFLIGLLIGRKGFWLNSLFFAGFLIIIWDPESIFSLSFQLSFLAVLFIGFTIRQGDDEKKKGNKFIRYLKSALLMTLAASIGTAPLVAYHFHYFSLISPLTNIIVAPVIGFILIPLSVASALLYLISGHFLFTPVLSAAADVSIRLVTFFAGISFADMKIPAFPLILVILFYTGFMFYFFLNKRSYALFIPFLPFIIYFFLPVFEKNILSLTCLDVGQGDSALVELPDGKTMVIDTGPTGRELASFLKYRGKKAIDFLVLSHVHPDHTGGLDMIMNSFDVKEIWDNGRIILPETFQGFIHRSFSRGDVIEGSGYRLYMLHPYPGFSATRGKEYDAENNDSLVMKIESNGKSVLFTGDIEEEAEENIRHLGKWLKSDVIKVPHHGSRSSAYAPFFRTVSPEIAVISAGKDNTFAHPHRETLDLLKGITAFRTDTEGAVTLRVTGDSLDIKTCKDFLFEKASSLSDEADNFKRLFRSW
jgi:competence protein ComEC